ncbi:hypothetical protein KP509_24G046100 [Ceratopteris richardii]|uniref:Uncharacterized protein n=1 Tax=Ceratopteris richardii TaxID=49495 RepID=A0A8T2RX29_CERRI|nr:hypothetical protein KP509_24G046100 [Ceratopteris richardii]
MACMNRLNLSLVGTGSLEWGLDHRRCRLSSSALCNVTPYVELGPRVAVGLKKFIIEVWGATCPSAIGEVMHGGARALLGSDLEGAESHGVRHKDGAGRDCGGRWVRAGTSKGGGHRRSAGKEWPEAGGRWCRWRAAGGGGGWADSRWGWQGASEGGGQQAEGGGGGGGGQTGVAGSRLGRRGCHAAGWGRRVQS